MLSYRGSEVTTNLGVIRCTSAHRLRKFRVFYFVPKLLAYLDFNDDLSTIFLIKSLPIGKEEQNTTGNCNASVKHRLIHSLTDERKYRLWCSVHIY